ncbi:hypothetical protein [Ruminococcus flavefaciens]|uniref:hypothetical protein n=1 Tax=Ruminococcus flavefaciens TaxID=1265 RepID=UPI0002F2718D|nr:hypothetical protein [Ruminococcus flavefaciens]
MLKNIFDSDELIVCRPNPELLEHIKSHNMKIDKIIKNTKWIALAFVIFMAVFWIGGDLAGWNSSLILVFGLLTIFGFPLIWALAAIWISRPSVKRRSDELCTMALEEMNIPDDNNEIELLFLKNIQDDFQLKKEYPFTNGIYLSYADSEALYIVDVIGTVRIPYSLMSPWTESDGKAKIRHWIHSGSPSLYSKNGVKKKSSLFSLIPFIGGFIPNHYLITYSYSVIRTVNAEYVLCIPSYELNNLSRR